MSTLFNSLEKRILEAFGTFIPPKLEWVKVIRATEVQEILLHGVYDCDLNWVELDAPMVCRIPKTIYCVVADYGEGPHGYCWSTEERQAEGVVNAILEGRLKDVIIFS